MHVEELTSQTYTQYVILLLFPYNNGCTNAPQCHVICTVTVLFDISFQPPFCNQQGLYSKETVDVLMKIYTLAIEQLVGQDRSNTIATRHVLDGPRARIPSRPALGSTQPSVQWIPLLFHRVKTAGAWR